MIEPGRDAYPGAPRWVKRFALATAALLAIVLIFLVVGTATGLHAPGGPGHLPASPAHSR